MKKVLILIIVCLISACNKPAYNTARNTNDNIVNIENQQESVNKEDLSNKLIDAVKENNLQLVHELIDKGADVNLKIRTKIDYDDIFEVTPLWVAAHMNHTKIVQTLLENGAKDSLEVLYRGGGQIAGIEVEDPVGTTPLFEASFNNNDEMVKLLLNAGAKDNIFNASMRGDLETVKSFIENGVDVNENYKGNSALTWAARFGHTEIVKFLIGKKADINMESYRNGPIIMFAAEGGYTDIVKLLIQAGANVNESGFLFVTPLMKAAEKGHTETVKTLLDLGANVNDKDDGGCSAIILAVKNGNIEIVKLLLDAGADTNIPEEIYLGDTGEEIINEQADPNYNLLMYAQENEQTEIVELLKSYGAKE